MTPLFTAERLAGYGAEMVTAASGAVDGWVAGGRPVEAHRALSDLTLAVVARTLFSVEVDSDLAGAVRRTLDSGMVLLPRARLPGSALLERLPAGRAAQWRRERDGLDRQVLALIARRRATDPGTDLLGRLVAARDPETGAAMADRQVRDEVVTLLLAGFETTADLLTWAVLEIGRRPEVRDRLEAEVDAVLGGRPATPAVALPYCGAVVAETLRLHPPAWLLVRRTAEPLELPTGHTLPGGATVLMPPWLIHRDPAWWRDPERFDPERWADASSPAPGEPARPRSAYLPFGAGPRQCLGNAFAMLEATLLLATLAQRVRLLPPPGLVVPPRPAVTLMPGVAVPLHVVPRR